MQDYFQNAMNKISPDFIIIGSMKAGTTSLCDYLSNSPDIFIPEIKEPHYFVAKEVELANARLSIPSLQLVSSELEYAKLFEKAHSSQKKGESSVSYFYYLNEFIDSIQSKLQHKSRKTKIILVVRNPVARAISQAKTFLQYDVISQLEDLKKFVVAHARSHHFVYDVLGSSDYSEKINILKSAFDDVFVLKGELLQTNPELALSSLSSFLEVPNLKIDKYISTNVSGIHRYQSLAWLENILRKKGLYKFGKSILGAKNSRKIKDYYYKNVLIRNFKMTEVEDYLNEKLASQIVFYNKLDDQFKL